MRQTAVALAILALGLSAQAAGVEQNSFACPSQRVPKMVLSATGEASVDIAVMLYNVEGLPFPARMGRDANLEAIGDALAALRAQCAAPHVVVVQEAFSATAAAIGRRAGYPYQAFGPQADAPRLSPSAVLAPDFLAERRFLVGERAPKLVNSGLKILSDFPILTAASEPYSAEACGGTDCLANKGAQFVRVAIPGVPVPLEILNTHMNSRKGAGVPYARSDEAHHAQTEELAGFLARHRDPANPLVIAADFNMGWAPPRFAYFQRHMPQALVHQHCHTAPCNTGLRFETVTPWLETQDLQAFDPGRRIHIRPVQLAAHFDGKAGPVLSDHMATIVTYRISWQPTARG